MSNAALGHQPDLKAQNTDNTHGTKVTDKSPHN